MFRQDKSAGNRIKWQNSRIGKESVRLVAGQNGKIAG